MYQNLNMSGWILYARQCRQLGCKIPVFKQGRNKILQYAHQGRVNVAAIAGTNRHCYRLMSQVSKKFDDARPDTKHDEESQENGKDLSNKTGRQKLSLVFAKYGVTAVVFHTFISLTSLGLCYVAVSSGLDIPGFLMKIGASESFSTSVAAKGASTFVIAYACHKIFMPVRIFLTVTCTPLIVYRLQRLGLLKAR